MNIQSPKFRDSCSSMKPSLYCNKSCCIDRELSLQEYLKMTVFSLAQRLTIYLLSSSLSMMNHVLYDDSILSLYRDEIEKLKFNLTLKIETIQSRETCLNVRHEMVSTSVSNLEISQTPHFRFQIYILDLKQKFGLEMKIFFGEE